MTHKAKTLSEAFLKVRDYLWDGTGNFADVYPMKESCICVAAARAKRARAITLAQRDMIQHIVEQRIYPYTSVTQYVHKVHKVAKPNMRDIQEYRHAWLIALSKEFADESANP